MLLDEPTAGVGHEDADRSVDGMKRLASRLTWWPTQPHKSTPTAGPPTAGELEVFLRSRLAQYKRPRTYEVAAEPLRGDDGKVRRSALRAQRLPKT